jgi:hypothetical protein
MLTAVNRSGRLLMIDLLVGFAGVDGNPARPHRFGHFGHLAYESDFQKPTRERRTTHLDVVCQVEYASSVVH